MTSPSTHFRLDLQQTIKLVVYALLLVNFALYIVDDMRAASYTMRNGGSILDWTSSFATTIDESAWFVLLLLFELETYVLSDEVQNRPGVMKLVHGIRLACYVFLVHSIYAFGLTYHNMLHVGAAAGISDLCQLIGPDISFLRNLEYTELTTANCPSLSTDTQFFFVEPVLVVTDSSGLAQAKTLGLVDIMEVIVWMLILFTIEAMVRLQDRNITRGTLVNVIKASKLVLYASLWCMAAYWVALGHYYFAWDEALWIVGFFAIEMNISEWKKEIEHEDKKVRSSDFSRSSVS